MRAKQANRPVMVELELSLDELAAIGAAVGWLIDADAVQQCPAAVELAQAVRDAMRADMC